MRFLLIRPKLDSDATAEQLRNKNHVANIDPLLRIEALKISQPAFNQYQAFIFTSSNSLRAYRFPDAAKSIKVFTVGQKTLKTAQENGFNDIISANGDVKKLSETIKSTLDPKDGPLLYFAGVDVAGSIEEDLTQAQFQVDVRSVYHAKAADNLNQTTISLLKDGKIDYIPFYSPRSALIFRKLVEKSKLEDTLDTVTALCLSAEVKSEISSLRWKKILTAKFPNQDALFKLVNIEF